MPGLFAVRPLPGRFKDPLGAAGVGGFGLASGAGFETMGLDPTDGLAAADGAGRFTCGADGLPPPPLGLPRWGWAKAKLPMAVTNKSMDILVIFFMATIW